MPPDAKTCLGCHCEKPLTQFALQLKGKHGRNSRCKACVTEKYQARRSADIESARAIDRVRVADWRRANPEKNRAGNTRAKTEMRRKVAAYKSARGCEDCGITDARVLDLHHRSADDKILAVSQMMYRNSWKAVLAEMDKCRVLCANCHRIEHSPDDAPRQVNAPVVQMTGGTFFRAT